MKKETNLEYAVKHKIVERIAREMKVSQYYRDDLIQEVYLTLCESEGFKETETVSGYIQGIITNEFFSDKSNFFKKYKRNGDVSRKKRREEMFIYEDGEYAAYKGDNGISTEFIEDLLDTDELFN